MITGWLRVLIAEDENLVSWALARSLEGIGCDVCVVDSGKKALEILKVSQFDIVITDLGLPEIDGLSLASKVKSSSPSVPVILLSTVDERSLEARREKGLIDAYLEKPFDLTELISTVRRIVRQTHGMDQAEKAV